MAAVGPNPNKLVLDIDRCCHILRYHFANIDKHWPTYFSAMIALRLSEVPIEIQQRILSKVDGVMKEGERVTEETVQELDREGVEDDEFTPSTLLLSLINMPEERCCAVIQVAGQLRGEESGR